MPDYEKMYHIMFNAATDAERLIAEAKRLAAKASDIMRKAQQECEGLYVDSADAETNLMSSTKAAGE